MIKLVSYTMRELQDMTSDSYLKHKQRTDNLNEPELLKVMANTIILRVQSSKFHENGKYHHQYILLKDLQTLVVKQKMSLREALDYAIDNADVHCACTCEAYLYWAYEYFGTAGDYTYGPYKNRQAPTRNNVLGRSRLCKHTDKAFQYIQTHREELYDWFSRYYTVVEEKQDDTFVSVSNDEVKTDSEKVEDFTILDTGVEEEELEDITPEEENEEDLDSTVEVEDEEIQEEE